jgi:xanthine dehydrogenase/oxidase
VSAIIYCDCGFTTNESTGSTAAEFAKNCYKAVAWNIVSSDVITNTPSNTYCRAPGTTQVNYSKKRLLFCDLVDPK